MDLIICFWFQKNQSQLKNKAKKKPLLSFTRVPNNWFQSTKKHCKTWRTTLSAFSLTTKSMLHDSLIVCIRISQYRQCLNRRNYYLPKNKSTIGKFTICSILGHFFLLLQQIPIQLSHKFFLKKNTQKVALISSFSDFAARSAGKCPFPNGLERTWWTDGILLIIPFGLSPLWESAKGLRRKKSGMLNYIVNPLDALFFLNIKFKAKGIVMWEKLTSK